MLVLDDADGKGGRARRAWVARGLLSCLIALTAEAVFAAAPQTAQPALQEAVSEDAEESIESGDRGTSSGDEGDDEVEDDVEDRRIANEAHHPTDDETET